MPIFASDAQDIALLGSAEANGQTRSNRADGTNEGMSARKDKVSIGELFGRFLARYLAILGELSGNFRSVRKL